MFSPYVSVCRCWVSGGLGVSSGLGHFILDQLHHVHHHPSHCGPEPLGGFRPGHCGQHVRGWPPAGVRPGWMSEVRFSFHNKLIISTFKTYSHSLTVPFWKGRPVAFSMPLLGRREDDITLNDCHWLTFLCFSPAWCFGPTGMSSHPVSCAPSCPEPMSWWSSAVTSALPTDSPSTIVPRSSISRTLRLIRLSAASMTAPAVM